MIAPSRPRYGCRTSNWKRIPWVKRNSEERISSVVVLPMSLAKRVMRKKWFSVLVEKKSAVLRMVVGV